MKKTELRVISNRKMRNIAKDQRWLSQRSHRLCQEFTIKKFKNHQKPNRKIKKWSYRSTCIWFYSNNKDYERSNAWKFHFCTIIYSLCWLDIKELNRAICMNKWINFRNLRADSRLTRRHWLCIYAYVLRRACAFWIVQGTQQSQ